MADHGLLFNHAFSNAPVCSVARTTLMTSCYGPRIGTQFHRRTVTVPLPGGLKMFPAYLREAGYFTTNNQKKDYNAVEGNDVWDQSSRNATWRNRKDGQPFFHMQTFATSHESSLHFPATDVTAKPTTTDPSSVKLFPYHPDTPTFRYTYARYLDRIRDIDDQIGKVVDQLQADGLLEDTFVFYFGDHGGVLPRGKGYAYESGLHVPLIVRVPRKWKHLVPADMGARLDGFVSFIDFGPTLLNLAGLSVPQEVDGRPFLGRSVTLSELEQRDEALGYADRFDEKYDLVRTLRKGRFEYVRRFQPFNADGLQNNYRYLAAAYREWRQLYQDGKLNDVQSRFFEPGPPEGLYDIDNDPHETVNLADDPAHAATLLAMRNRLNEILRGMPDLSLVPENELVDDALSAPTAFAARNHQRLADVAEVADLGLAPFAQAKSSIQTALSSTDRWQRYWAAIACSTHGADAVELLPVLQELSETDQSLLVRVRAAEALALVGELDSSRAILAALYESKSGVEAALILNSVVMLQDGGADLKFQVDRTRLSRDVRENDSVKRRLEYLAPAAQ